MQEVVPAVEPVLVPERPLAVVVQERGIGLEGMERARWTMLLLMLRRA